MCPIRHRPYQPWFCQTVVDWTHFLLIFRQLSSHWTPAVLHVLMLHNNPSASVSWTCSMNTVIFKQYNTGSMWGMWQPRSRIFHTLSSCRHPQPEDRPCFTQLEEVLNSEDASLLNSSTDAETSDGVPHVLGANVTSGRYIYPTLQNKYLYDLDKNTSWWILNASTSELLCLWHLARVYRLFCCRVVCPHLNVRFSPYVNTVIA